MSIKKGKAPIAFRLAIALTAVLAISACSSDDDDDAPAIDPDQSAMTDADAMTGADANSVTVLLDAAQEIPAPVGVPAEAMGSAEVSVDDAGVVTATLTVSGLTGPATAAHIHMGFPGETGGVIVGLSSDDGGSTWTVAADAEPLTEDQIGAFNRGELYFNVHTEANMPGEIRGQIEPAATMASSETPRLLANVAELDGSKTLLDTRTGLVWANDVQFCSVGDIQAQASNCGVLSDMAVSGITDWRLATSSEMAEITRAVNSDANVSFGYDGGTCAVMTNDNESVIAGVRCVSGNRSQ